VRLVSHPSLSIETVRSVFVMCIISDFASCAHPKKLASAPKTPIAAIGKLLFARAGSRGNTRSNHTFITNN
jgi:hypothetical protein